MTPDNATTLCLCGLGFGAVGLLTRLFASHPRLVLRCLTGRPLRRTPNAWTTPEWRQGMRVMSWLQLALRLAMVVLGGCWHVV